MLPGLRNVEHSIGPHGVSSFGKEKLNLELIE